jgi:UPF0755 protein
VSRVRLAAALGALAALLLAGGAVWSASRLYVPAGPGGESQVFTVEAGEPLAAVARRLEDRGLLVRAPLFGPRVLVAYARATGADRRVKSGEYDLDPSMRAVDVLAKLVSGAVKTYAVTLPEGLRLDEVAARLAAAGIVETEAFLARARDPELAEELGLEGETLEGYLYPETYRFRRGAEPDRVLARMLEEFEARWTDADRAALAASGFRVHELVTLASVIEKETSVDAERPLVAAVFRNRLARGMRLQSDPTVIYGILDARGRFDGNLRRSDLERDTRYNTYTRAGLPPGPIASTSIESIRAALAPADVAYLYFVSRNDGTHHFSATHREHVNAVNRYQRRRRKGS